MERPIDEETILLSSLEVKLFIVRQREKRPLVSGKLEVVYQTSHHRHSDLQGLLFDAV